MRFLALVELAPEIGQEGLERLLGLAYRASRKAPVVIALTDVPVQTCNRILDAVLPSEGIHVHGVLYVNTHSERVIELSRMADATFSVTDALRGRLRTQGISPADTASALRYLSGLTPSNGAEPAPAADRWPRPRLATMARREPSRSTTSSGDVE